MPRGVRNVAPAAPVAPGGQPGALTDKPSVSPSLFLDCLKLVYRHDKTPADLVERAGELHDQYLVWASRKAPQQTPG